MKRLISTLTIVSILSLGMLYAQKADNESVTRLYIASFDRTPDMEGLNYWVNQSNLELEQISTSFFEQDEMKQKYPATSTNGDFINSVYKNLFNRTPDEDGLKYWEGELNSQSVSSSEFILAVVNGATGDDSTALDTKTQSALSELNITTNGDCTSAQAPVLENYTKTELTTEQKYSLAYMWHEEKLAKEIYLELNKIHPSEQLVNIANNAEVKHIEYVQNLVEWYDINVTNIADYEINYSADELNSMAVGLFALPEIQSLYDMLYDKGITSLQDTLEVGCMVEVTDVNDLDKYIVEAGDNMALVDTFNILRDGSYNHYWSFDKALKNMGIADGCCSLGSEYCHSEYPQNENGQQGGGDTQGQGEAQQGDGQGQQHQYGKN